MISYDEALNLIRAQVKAKLPTVNLPIADALNAVSVQDVICDCYVSPFDNSAMDGFAVRYADLQQDICQMEVLGSSFAGDEIGKGVYGAWEIMTGAGMPDGFDTVIKIEDTSILKTEKSGKPLQIRLNIDPKSIIFENNIRKKGQDFKPDDVIVKQNEIINSAHIAALASVGIAKIKCYQKPQIALLSTGKEIIDDPNQALKSGQIRNSNAPSLMATFVEMGINANYLGTIADEVKIYEKCLKNALKTSNIIISTGAVSMGRHDFIPDSLRELGAEIIFHKCKIRPGKPILFAKFPPTINNPNGVFYFGLPGNPISASLGLRFFVAPLLKKLQNRPKEQPIKAYCLNKNSKKHNLKMFYKAFASLDNGKLGVKILQGQESFKIKSLIQANCWAVIDENQHETSANELVNIYPIIDNNWRF